MRMTFILTSAGAFYLPQNIGLFQKKKCAPLLRISTFWSWPHWISSRIYLDSLGFSIFLHWPPWKSMFFPQLLVYPRGIPTTFTLPPWNFPLIFHWIFHWVFQGFLRLVLKCCLTYKIKSRWITGIPWRVVKIFILYSSGFIVIMLFLCLFSVNRKYAATVGQDRNMRYGFNEPIDIIMLDYSKHKEEAFKNCCKIFNSQLLKSNLHRSNIYL